MHSKGGRLVMRCDLLRRRAAAPVSVVPCIHRLRWPDRVQRFATGVLIVSCSCSFVRKLPQFAPCSARRTVDPDPCVVAHLMADGLLAGYVLTINDVELVPGPEDHPGRRIII